ncbi:MAG: hypothetical protein VX498_08025, partial [Myxococcota bacterium]|nr:hypothetical protein [Myxococcota bacterium]
MKEPAPLHLDDLDDSPVPHRVKMSGHGKNLVDYVLDLIDKVPEEELRRSVAEGRFQLADGTVLTAESRLEFGQELLVRVPRVVADDPFLPPPKKPLPFLYFDSDLLAVDKAPGLLSYPLGPRRVSALTIATRQLDARGEPSELRPLHRIDLETSGV